jgi:hypothetical protein
LGEDAVGAFVEIALVDSCLVIPTKVLKLHLTCFVLDLYEINSKKEERKTQSIEFKLHPRQRTIQSRLRSFFWKILFDVYCYKRRIGFILVVTIC